MDPTIADVVMLSVPRMVEMRTPLHAITPWVVIVVLGQAA